MTHNITFASPDDANELVAIYRPYVESTTITFEYDVPSVQEFRQRIETISNNYPYLIYTIGDQIVGYAYASTFKTRSAFMWDVETSVYIKEEYHHKGIAAALYKALLSILKTQGFYHAYAYITYPNPKSIAFHDKFGFQEIGKYKNTGYKLGTWCDLICMEKQLNDIAPNQAPKPYIPISKLEDVSSLLSLCEKSN